MTYDPNDLTGTDNLVSLGQEPAQREKTGKTGKAKKATKKKPAGKSTTKRGAPIAQPSQSIDDAIAAGVPPRELDALVKVWSQYNMQEAARKAKEATEAMASSVQARRRKIADELLKIADGYGISMSEARNIFEEARAAEKGGKLK